MPFDELMYLRNAETCRGLGRRTAFNRGNTALAVLATRLLSRIEETGVISSSSGISPKSSAMQHLACTAMTNVNSNFSYNYLSCRKSTCAFSAIPLAPRKTPHILKRRQIETGTNKGAQHEAASKPFSALSLCAARVASRSREMAQCRLPGTAGNRRTRSCRSHDVRSALPV